GEERVLLAGDLGDRVGQGRRVGDQLADALAQELRIEELFGVLPLVERLALVEPLVALETNEPAARDLRQRLRELGLADARRPLDEHGTPHARGQVDDGGDPAARDIARIPETLLDVLHGLEHAGSLLPDEFPFIVSAFRPAAGPFACTTGATFPSRLQQANMSMKTAAAAWTLGAIERTATSASSNTIVNAFITTPPNTGCSPYSVSPPLPSSPPPLCP